jgi:hypothetical protein
MLGPTTGLRRHVGPARRSRTRKARPMPLTRGTSCAGPKRLNLSMCADNTSSSHNHSWARGADSLGRGAPCHPGHYDASNPRGLRGSSPLSQANGNTPPTPRARC